MLKLKYFSKEKDVLFKCQCKFNCNLGFDDMNPRFMQRLDNARHDANVSFKILSGARCPEHNNNVSKTGFDGPHTKLCAVDIETLNSRHRFIILDALLRNNFNRIGISPKFIHVDSDETGDPDVVWFY